MKTLILNGSPRGGGDASFLIEKLSGALRGEIKLVNCRDADISPCTDCRACRKSPSCTIDDEMRDIYDFLAECDNVVIASPVHYGELSSLLLKVASRFQVYSSAMIFRHEAVKVAAKHGAVILSQGGGTSLSSCGGSERAYETARLIFRSLGIKEILPCVCAAETDTIPAADDEAALEGVRRLAGLLNSREVSPELFPEAAVTMKSTPQEKIELFRSLFRGREDVYALRFQNNKTGTSGYAPVCNNKWVQGVCAMPKVKCAACKNRSFKRLGDTAIFAHLSGKDELCRDVIGIYPMLPDETTFFLAIDFGGGDWQSDISAVRKVCENNRLSCAVERSRSGEGGHLWIFFDTPLSAAKARQLGSALITAAMNERHEISFDLYDRMFPDRDTMPIGGFGNLIALPLQKQAVRLGNSLFADRDFLPYPDQWAFLSSVERLDEQTVDDAIERLCGGTSGMVEELGELYSEEPREIRLPENAADMFPKKINAVFADMIYIPIDGISQAGLNRLKRLASFKNPEFYKAQAMRMSTYDKPRVISLAKESADSDGVKCIMLPRGCMEALEELLSENGCKLSVEDKRFAGRAIDVSFNGELRPDQRDAVEALTAAEGGVLAATTAFGKTVTAIGLIAERRVGTLILVHTQALLQQWKKSLEQFLIINEEVPEQLTPTGRRKKTQPIGQLGGSKNTLTGIVDIAIMQSLISDDGVKPVINDYGMVIVDECHHVSAVSFETILREAHAKYVYGLTATPKRSDGHQPIIFMQCGAIRYTASAGDYAEKHSFEHILVPRFTRFREDAEGEKPTITDIYRQLTENEQRSAMIAADVGAAVKAGRTPIVISERMSHIERLSELLKDSADNVIILSGQGTAKTKKELLERVKNVPKSETLILLATGKYAGEGFDEPRLDTLFLAMPISWSGTLAQYVGRLHREYEGKTEVRIYDYIDIRVRMLENMYKKRLREYTKLGYVPEEDLRDGYRSLYTENAAEVLMENISEARKIVLAVGSDFDAAQLEALIRAGEKCRKNGVKFAVVLKSSNKNYCQQIPDKLAARKITYFERKRLTNSFTVIDGRTVWYSTGELFGGEDDDECVLRVEDEGLASELVDNLGS